MKNLKKINRSNLKSALGGIRPDQCFYTDPATGKRKIGCRMSGFFDSSGNWVAVLPGMECTPCFD